MFDESRGNSRKDQEMGAEDLSRSIEGLKQKRARVLSVSAEVSKLQDTYSKIFVESRGT